MTHHPTLRFVATAILVPFFCGVADPPKSTPQAKTHRVPYRMSETLHMIVRAKFNGKGPYNFIVDTGAPAMFVTKAVAKEVGVENGKDGWATFDEMEIEGGAKIKDAKARVEDIFQIRGMNSLGLPGVRLDGVLGYNILARYRMEFDLAKSHMTWTELDFDPPLPQPLGGEGGKSAPPELEMIGSLMQDFGAFFNRGQPPPPGPRGFVGMELADGDDAVQIKSVIPKAPAGAAGLKPGDTLIEFAGKPVKSAADVLKLATTIGIGEEIRVVVKRENKNVELTVTTGKGF
jgi:hypothetical protein